MPQDTTQDTARDGRWMTYGEIAQSRGIDRQSAVKLVRRHSWRRQPGNNSEVRVFVPSEGLSRAGTRDGTPDETRVTTQPIAPDTTAFETAFAAIETAHLSEVAALRERADAAEVSRVATQTIADKALTQLAEAEKRVEAERSRADRAEQAIGSERSRADAAETRAQAAQTEAGEASQQAREAQQTAEALRRALEAAEIARADAEADVEEIRQAEHARKARGRWARLREAWRGE